MVSTVLFLSICLSTFFSRHHPVFEYDGILFEYCNLYVRFRNTANSKIYHKLLLKYDHILNPCESQTVSE